MSKRFFQIAAAFVAVLFLVLAPIACQQAEQATEGTETATPAGPANGKKLMAATPKTDAAVADAEEAVEGALDEAGIEFDGQTSAHFLQMPHKI